MIFALNIPLHLSSGFISLSAPCPLLKISAPAPAFRLRPLFTFNLHLEPEPSFIFGSGPNGHKNFGSGSAQKPPGYAGLWVRNTGPSA